MRRTHRGVALLIVAIFVLPLLAQDKAPDKKDIAEPKKDEAKKDDPKKDETKKDEPKKVEPKKESPYKAAGTVAGKIVQLDEGKKWIKISVEIQSLNPDAVRGMQNAQLNLARAKTPQERQNALNDYANHQKNQYKIDHKDAEFNCVDDVKVRATNPPVRFNEKGDITKPTKTDLDEMKGPDKTLPGYTSEFGELRVGNVVQLTLVTRKDLPPWTEVIKGKKPDEITPEMAAPYKTHISLIVSFDMPAAPGK